MIEQTFLDCIVVDVKNDWSWNPDFVITAVLRLPEVKLVVSEMGEM